MLPGTWDDNDVVLAGSPHAHVHAHWIPTRPCLCLLDPCTHTLTGYACTHALGPHMHTRPTHACTGPMHACLQGPHARLLTGPILHACTRSLCLLARGAHLACLHRAMHARLHRAMHAHSHQAPTPTRSPCMHAPGPCAHARSGSPCLLACGVPMHVRWIPALVHVASHVVCSSSYM